MKLTKRLLEAIREMADRVEAGTTEDYRGYDRPEDEAAYDAACDAGLWARQELRRREARKAKSAR